MCHLSLFKLSSSSSSMGTFGSCIITNGSHIPEMLDATSHEPMSTRGCLSNIDVHSLEGQVYIVLCRVTPCALCVSSLQLRLLSVVISIPSCRFRHLPPKKYGLTLRQMQIRMWNSRLVCKLRCLLKKNMVQMCDRCGACQAQCVFCDSRQ